MAMRRTETTEDAISGLENTSIESSHYQEQTENLLNEKLNSVRDLCTVTITATKPTKNKDKDSRQ